ncbi:MAG: hypothetical protein IJT44_04790 [Clostridia bacterium]|nr:hypothetical protein [Clostridia bacterium]
MDYDLSSLTDALPRDAAELLERMGISGADFSGLFEVSFRDVAEGVLGVFRGALHAPLSFLAAGVCVLLLLVVMNVFGEKQSALRSFLSGLFLLTVCAVPFRSVISTAVSAVRTGSAFLATLIPVLGAVVAASGSPVLSVCWQTAVFAAAQTVAAAASGFMAPACGLMLGTGVLDCLSPDGEGAGLTEKIRKCSVWIFSALATLFTAFLSLKSMLAGAADTVAAKGIKLAVSSLIPVVGPQLSDAYAGVAGSLAAVRSTAGVFAVAGVCAVALPAVAQMLLWIAALRTLHMLCTLLDQKSAAKLFAAFASALSVLHACLLFVTALYVISLGIILTVKADL